MLFRSLAGSVVSKIGMISPVMGFLQSVPFQRDPHSPHSRYRPVWLPYLDWLARGCSHWSGRTGKNVIAPVLPGDVALTVGTPLSLASLAVIIESTVVNRLLSSSMPEFLFCIFLTRWVSQSMARISRRHASRTARRSEGVRLLRPGPGRALALTIGSSPRAEGREARAD